MPERVRARQGPLALPGGLLSVGFLAACLLWAWYVWIFAPSLGVERDRAMTGNLVQDAWLAALAIESGCEWVTTDRDYARFPGLRWREPF